MQGPPPPFGRCCRLGRTWDAYACPIALCACLSMVPPFPRSCSIFQEAGIYCQLLPFYA